MEFEELGSRAELAELEAELNRERCQPDSKVTICDLGAEEDLNPRYFAARIDGQHAGAATFTQTDDGGCELYKLYVHPAFRQRGVGAALAEKVMTIASELNYPEINIEMSGDSLAFWDRWVGERPFDYHGTRKFSVHLQPDGRSVEG